MKRKQTQKLLCVSFSCLLVLLLSSCVKERKIVEVKIISVYQNKGSWITLIEDEDGMRKRIYGKMGEPSESFKITRLEFHRIYVGDKFRYSN